MTIPYPEQCPIGQKYDYSPMTSGSDPFTAKLIENNSSNYYEVTTSSNGTRLTYVSAPIGANGSCTEWPAIDMDQDYSMSLSIRFNGALSYDPDVLFIIRNSSSGVDYGILVYRYQYSNRILITMRAGYGTYYVLRDAIEPPDTWYKIEYKKVGDLLYGYINGQLAGTYVYDSSAHANITNKRPQISAYGGISGSQKTIIDLADIYIVGSNQSNTCTGIPSTTTPAPPFVYPSYLLDSGKVYLNYGLPSQVLLGETRGGNTFEVEQEPIDMGHDGATGSVMKARRLSWVTPRLTVKGLKPSLDMLKMALPASDSETIDIYDLIQRSLQLTGTNHYSNVALVQEVYGKSEPIVYMLLNPSITSKFDMASIDGQEAGIDMIFTGHYETVNGADPWLIRYPKDNT